MVQPNYNFKQYYNIRPQPTQSFVPTPRAQVQIPTMGMSAGLKTPIFGSQIPTMRFADFLENDPFTKRYTSMTPEMRGQYGSQGTRTSAPSTRFIYF